MEQPSWNSVRGRSAIRSVNTLDLKNSDPFTNGRVLSSCLGQDRSCESQATVSPSSAALVSLRQEILRRHLLNQAPPPRVRTPAMSPRSTNLDALSSSILIANAKGQTYPDSPTHILGGVPRQIHALQRESHLSLMKSEAIRRVLESQALARNRSLSSVSALLSQGRRPLPNERFPEAVLSHSRVLNSPKGDSSILSSSASRMEPKSTLSSIQLSNPLTLAMPSDKYSISPLHCFVRRYCVEIFTLSELDYSHCTLVEGKRNSFQVGQVGIRCPYCFKVAQNNPLSSRFSPTSITMASPNKSLFFPPTIALIYESTMNFIQDHTHVCESIPPETIRRYYTLMLEDAKSTSQKYWIESAKALGLVDTPYGIKMSNSIPLSIHNFLHSDDFKSSQDDNFERPFKSTEQDLDKNEDFFKDILGGPLVSADQKHLATAYSYALLSQMQSCVFTEADHLGKRKGLPLGFPGLACRHCYDDHKIIRSGSGRFFPSTIKTMADTGKSLNTIHKHMMNCWKCPLRVRKGLITLRLTHEKERSRMKFGSQKAFFVTIWRKLHGDMPSDYQRGICPCPVGKEVNSLEEDKEDKEMEKEDNEGVGNDSKHIKKDEHGILKKGGKTS